MTHSNKTKPNPRVKPSPIHGMGLFAERDYDKGDFITRYGGLKLGPKETQFPSAYRLKDDFGYVWDAQFVTKPLEEKGRWINDILGHEEEYDYNCEFVTHTVKGHGCWVRATEDVKEGEEFFIPYGPKYWDRINDQDEEDDEE